MSDNYSEDIAAWQSGWDTPTAVLDAVVRRAGLSHVTVDERIFEGHGNEVHAVTTSDGQDLVVRICRRPGAAFECEQWPIAAARAAGVPVPEILLIEHICLNGEELSVQVQRRVPGTPVYRLFGELSNDRLAALTRQAGRVLAAVHRIRPPGAGPIDPAGNRSPRTPPPSETMAATMLERNVQLADEGLDPALLHAPLAAVATGAALLDDAPVSLIHGDWRTTNLLSDGTSITGVVDWEGGRGGDAAFDFAGVWTVRSRPQPTSTELLLESYRAEGGPVDATFDVRRFLYRLADLHSALGYFVVTKRPDLLQFAVEDLRSTLRRLDAVL